MDVLADIIGVAKLSSSLYFRATLRAPFSIAVPADGQRIRFHIMGPGTCWIGLPSGESVSCHEGDLVLIPHGSEHVLAECANTPAKPLGDVLKEADHRTVGHLVYGGDGPECILVCGHFAFNEVIIHPILKTLPRIIHISAEKDQDYSWLEIALRYMREESELELPGHQEILRRLSEILFIQVLRAFMKRSDKATNELTALVDPHLGRALSMIHKNLGSNVTLDGLAEYARLSRSIFAERFRKKMGVPPMKYLAQWRMQKARALLVNPALTVGEVAIEVGYSSQAAFNTVYKDYFGVTPGRHRKSKT